MSQVCYSDLLTHFCQLKGLQLEWQKCDCFNGKDQNRHTLMVTNGHIMDIRHIEQTLFPGTNQPTYIMAAYIAPTYLSFEECCKKIVEASLGKWWTGLKVIFAKELPEFPSGYAPDSKLLVRFGIEFPVSIAHLQLLLAVNGY